MVGCMYKEYFGLKEPPFSIAPDPRYLYMSEGHCEALAHLRYGLRGDGGFVLLTGEVGTGKTTVCRSLLGEVPDDLNIAFILNPRVTVVELLAGICDELSIVYPEGNLSVKVFADRINEFLIESHSKRKRTVLIIEEAQNLSFDVLEQLRLLTNLETNEHKLMQIIMVGQPELREILGRTELRQLEQRITARYHLGPLSDDEVANYVSHRLSVGGRTAELFQTSALRKLFRLTRGIPRLINVVCDRALLGAYVQGKDRVDTETLTKAAREVFGKTKRTLPMTGREKLLAGVMFVLIGVVLPAVYYHLKTSYASVIAGAVGQAHVNAGSSEPPRLDTLWWFDRRSSLWHGARWQDEGMRYEERWTAQGPLQKPNENEEDQGQYNDRTLSRSSGKNAGRTGD